MLPDKVKEPVPAFVKAPVPVPSSLWIVPEKIVDELSPPTVRTSLLVISIVPAPAIEPTVSELLISKIAPLSTVTAVLSDKVPERVKVPSLIVVVPE